MDSSPDVDMAPAVDSSAVSLENAPVVAETLPSVELALPSEAVYALVCSWKGQKLDVTVVESDTVGDLKATLWSLTSVPPHRQKLVGLVKGKLPGDEAEVVSLGLGGGAPKQFMMVSLARWTTRVFLADTLATRIDWYTRGRGTQGDWATCSTREGGRYRLFGSGGDESGSSGREESVRQLSGAAQMHS